MVSDLSTVYNGAGLPTTATKAGGDDHLHPRQPWEPPDRRQHDQHQRLELHLRPVRAPVLREAGDELRLGDHEGCCSPTMRLIARPPAPTRDHDLHLPGPLRDPRQDARGFHDDHLRLYRWGRPWPRRPTPRPRVPPARSPRRRRRLVTTAAANQGTSAYDPWGKVLGVSGTQSVLGYQGDITDAVTRQVDMGTRWYTPSQGRFSARDRCSAMLTR